MLLAFAPFVVFAVIDRLLGATEGLFAGTAMSAALILRDVVTPGRRQKILEMGTFVLFGGLALYTALSGAAWSVIGVRLCVDAGLLLIVLASIVSGRPFTLQYARERIAPEFWGQPEFLRTNYVLSSVWALAFAVIVAAELALLYLPDLPPRLGVIAIAVVLFGAFKFTAWYPDRPRAVSSQPTNA